MEFPGQGAGRLAAKGRRQEIPGPEHPQHHPPEGPAPLGDAGDGQPLGIDRGEDQETRLGLGFLHQGDRRGGPGLAGIPGGLDGRQPLRVGAQVIAQGRPIGFQGLQEGHGEVPGAVRCGPQVAGMVAFREGLEVGVAHPEPGFGLGPVRGPDQGRPLEGLDAVDPLLLGGHEGVEVLPVRPGPQFQVAGQVIEEQQAGVEVGAEAGHPGRPVVPDIAEKVTADVTPDLEEDPGREQQAAEYDAARQKTDVIDGPDGWRTHGRGSGVGSVVVDLVILPPPGKVGTQALLAILSNSMGPDPLPALSWRARREQPCEKPSSSSPF